MKNSRRFTNTILEIRAAVFGGKRYLQDNVGYRMKRLIIFGTEILAQANISRRYFRGFGGRLQQMQLSQCVFKSLSSSSGEVVGASYKESRRWGMDMLSDYEKLRSSDSIHVDVGSPKRLIFTESQVI